jgi:hypothetical protein
MIRDRMKQPARGASLASCILHSSRCRHLQGMSGGVGGLIYIGQCTEHHACLATSSIWHSALNIMIVVFSPLHASSVQIEGLPSVLLGFAMMAWLPASPLGLKQLSQEQQQALHEQVRGQLTATVATRHSRLLHGAVSNTPGRRYAVACGCCKLAYLSQTQWAIWCRQAAC